MRGPSFVPGRNSDFLGLAVSPESSWSGRGSHSTGSWGSLDGCM